MSPGASSGTCCQCAGVRAAPVRQTSFAPLPPQHHLPFPPSLSPLSIILCKRLRAEEGRRGGEQQAISSARRTNSPAFAPVKEGKGGPTQPAERNSLSWTLAISRTTTIATRLNPLRIPGLLNLDRYAHTSAQTFVTVNCHIYIISFRPSSCACLGRAGLKLPSQTLRGGQRGSPLWPPPKKSHTLNHSQTLSSRSTLCADRALHDIETKSFAS